MKINKGMRNGGYIGRPVLRGDCQEAKIGEAGWHRITRNGEALGVFLLTCATPALSLIAIVGPDRCNSSGSAMDACQMTLPHGWTG